MKSSHRGLGITEQEWDILVRHIVAVFDVLGVGEPERSEVLEAAASLKWEIVEAPQPAAAR